MRRKLFLGVIMVLLSLPLMAALAQDTPATTEEPATTEVPTGGEALVLENAVASGLNNPRHIFFGSDGTLYIAEAGQGGDIEAQGPFGPVKAGLTSQVSAVTPNGTQSVVLPGLVSMDAGFGQIEGVTSVIVTDDSYWLTLGMGTQEPVAEGALTMSVVEIDKASGEVRQAVDLAAYEQENNPDSSQERVSNPADLALAPDGKLYIADASGNTVLLWTADTGLQLFASWPVTDSPEDPQAVPTGVAVGPDGDVYVSFLSGFPFPRNGARIERYSADGTLKETYADLTLVTDVLVTDDGTVYAVEMADGFGDAGYNANSGSVVKIVDGEVGTVVEGLNYPYGIAQDASGAL
ncbi:MAG: ScyD/ScyE family protein, partial [Anaerolineae bacterium]|nr:ScyD/ScyE family protein [Anaerolineae bacterium]